jgi:hypothetical protein
LGALAGDGVASNGGLRELGDRAISGWVTFSSAPPGVMESREISRSSTEAGRPLLLGEGVDMFFLCAFDASEQRRAPCSDLKGANNDYR